MLDPRTLSNVEHVSFLLNIAGQNIAQGIIDEPRAYYDAIPINQDDKTIAGSLDVLTNGEQFPIRITHVTAALAAVDQAGVAVDERFIQRIGMNLRFHDQLYPNPEFVPLPLWHNVVASGPDPISPAVSNWRFDRPIVLSARDSLAVTVFPEQSAFQANQSATFGLMLHCVGLKSRRPYVLSSNTTVGGSAFPSVANLNSFSFRNDGTEPLVPVSMSTFVSGGGVPATRSSTTGDIRRARVQIVHQGNGTTSYWFQGPLGSPGDSGTAPLPGCPASLLGPTVGRSIVHRLPGEGFLWDPGEGVKVQTQQVGSGDSDNGILYVGLLGYISIPGK